MRYVLTPQKHCVICQQRDKALHILISTFIEDLNQPDLLQALQASEGLCFPHLKLAFEAVREVEASNILLSIHREKLESLRGELDEFMRKNDYRFADEGFGAEGDSWRRAVGKVAGEDPR